MVVYAYGMGLLRCNVYRLSLYNLTNKKESMKWKVNEK